MDFAPNEIQASLCQSIETFASKELNHAVIEDDSSAEFPWEGWRRCGDLGITGLPLPEALGGQGADCLTTAMALQTLAYACKDSGLVHAIIAHMLAAVQIHVFGTEEQKQKYLPRASKGEIVLAQAITEPDSGSDALAMRSKAERVGSDYRINGTKTFISNGPIADVALVFAVTNPERRTFGGISCFVVEKEDPGFVRGEPIEKMGLRTLQNGELVLTDCVVQGDRILGGEGRGMTIFNEGMVIERTLLFACHLGILQRVLKTCIRYASERTQGGQVILKHQFILDKIARMAMNLELGRLVLQKAAWQIDQRKRATLEASIAKLFISESLESACLDAVQIHGAYGYMREFEIERDLRNSIASTIYSGTSEIQKIIIATLSAT